MGIARALVKNANILLADEPTGNLDSKSSYEIMGILQRLNKEEGLTVVIVTHEPDIGAHAGRVVSMRDGLVVADEPVKQPRQADTPRGDVYRPSQSLERPL